MNISSNQITNNRLFSTSKFNYKDIVGSIPAILKILLAIFIIVAALGVGELFEKIELMSMDF
ncbi:hypothetical protein [Gillisia limnaea]|uniref:Uncharacterized protein n=1 Tax=Gillisia limnaea (strain DSM 15749 / LMG 21470 / R-8282) TaxID=865937 RepID=H2BUJ6_GILLR|nr:hypothetical protein [Gillisia limnaea]EHQ03874.1 hypothetical protein Gilli_3267 [Gillisia limnaea DSM 15749]